METICLTVICGLGAEPDIGLLAGIVTAQRLRDIAAAEAGIAPPTLAFLQTALPAAPALILGFLCLEGRSLVRSSPSPASCACAACAAPESAVALQRKPYCSASLMRVRTCEPPWLAPVIRTVSARQTQACPVRRCLSHIVHFLNLTHRKTAPNPYSPSVSQVAHELSVPAVSTILLSMLFWTAGHSAGVLLAEQAPAALPPRLAFAAAAVTLPVEIGVRGDLVWVAAASICVLGLLPALLQLLHAVKRMLLKLA